MIDAGVTEGGGLPGEAGSPSGGARLSDTRRIAALLRPHTRALAAAAALAAVIAACRGGIIWLLRDVLDTLLVDGDPRARWLLPAAMVALFAVLGAARFARTLLTRRAALAAEDALRRHLFDKLLRTAPPELQKRGLASALSRLAHDAGAIRAAVAAAVTALQRPLSAVAILGAAVVMAPALTALSAVVLPAVAWVIARASTTTRAAATRRLAARERLELAARDALRGLRVLQAHGAEGAASALFARRSEDLRDAAVAATAKQVAASPVVELTAALGGALVLFVGAGQVAAGALTPGELVAFAVAIGLLNEPLKGLAQASALWGEARGGMARVFELLDAPEAAPDAPSARALGVGPVSLELRGVAVERGGASVLRGVDLQVEPGDLVVLQGESGAGKTTLLDVIAGFVPADGVHWAGEPAAAWTLASRRDALAFVDQHPWLPAGTVAEAVALGRPGASVESIAEALARAGLGALVERLDRPVGDGAHGLSGGEIQRLALARALLRDAPVLLLDEPTSQLDAAHERAFLEHLAANASGRAVVLVTHRPAALSIATAAYELVDGRLVALTTARAAAS